LKQGLRSRHTCRRATGVARKSAEAGQRCAASGAARASRPAPTAPGRSSA
jgi:hypothetical protein